MSTLSELFPAGGGDNTIDMVASGTLPNGSPVILKADGTVEVVGESSTTIAESIPAGTEVTITGLTWQLELAYNPNIANQFVISYRDGDNSSYGTAIVGTVSGTTITFGSAVVFNSGSTFENFIHFDPNTSGKFVVTYVDGSNSSSGTAVVGTVSGTSITFGSEYVFNSGSTSNSSSSFDPSTAGSFVVTYRDNGGTGYGYAKVGTISGTGITYGSEYAFNSETTYSTSISFDPNTAGKFVVAYKDSGSDNIGKTVVGTISGTSISYGSVPIFAFGNMTYNSVAFDPNTVNKFTVAYVNASNSNYASVVVGTISGTSITFGSAYILNSGNTARLDMAFEPSAANKFVVSFINDSNSGYLTAIIGTVSGTSISYGSGYILNTGDTDFSGISFDPNTAGKFAVTYKDNANSGAATAIVGQVAATVSATNLTSTNLLGISQKAVADGETTSVETLGGLSAVHSGLTIGSDYYVATDGSLTTTSTDNVSIGKAISATEINMRDYV